MSVCIVICSAHWLCFVTLFLFMLNLLKKSILTDILFSSVHVKITKWYLWNPPCIYNIRVSYTCTLHVIYFQVSLMLNWYLTSSSVTVYWKESVFAVKDSPAESSTLSLNKDTASWHQMLYHKDLLTVKLWQRRFCWLFSLIQQNTNLETPKSSSKLESSVTWNICVMNVLALSSLCSRLTSEDTSLEKHTRNSRTRG